MTVSELLSSLSAYPIPADFISAAGSEVGIDVTADFKTLEPKTLYWLKARTYFYLATMPNVSEGGVSISLSAADKQYFLSLARKFAALAGDETMIPGAAYGYKGENL